MKIILIGGHFSPALSLIEHLQGEDILYIGRKNAIEGDEAVSLEYKTLKNLDVKFTTITTGRLQRKFSKQTIPSLLKTPSGFLQAFKILKEFNPDIVVGFGGYLSVPVVFAASFLKIPVVIHEQTLEAGFANKILSRFAKKICISWESSFKFFPKEKTVLTGNPVRKEILEAKKYSPDKNSFQIYVTGGSLGSHKINDLIRKYLKQVLKVASVIHQTGDAESFNDYEKLQEEREKLEDELKNKYKLVKFIDPADVGRVMAESNLVISRSGANTISELIYLNKPSLLIPLSFAQNDEQKKNALLAKKLGIAEIFEENEAPEVFMETLNKMIANVENHNIKDASLSTDAAEKLINVIKETAGVKK